MLRNSVSALCVRFASPTAPSLWSHGTAVITEPEFTAQQKVPAQRGDCSVAIDGDVTFDIGMRGLLRV